MSRFTWPSVKEAEEAQKRAVEKKSEQVKADNLASTDPDKIGKAAEVALGKENGDLIREAVASALREHGIDKVDRRHLQFPGSGNQPSGKGSLNVRYMLDAETPLKHWSEDRKAEVRTGLTAFLRQAIYGKSVKESLEDRGVFDEIAVRTLSIGTDSAGGYLVPPGYIAYLVEDVPRLAQLLPLVTVFPVGEPAGTLPTVSANASVSWGSENTAITASDPTFGEQSWSVTRLNVYNEMSRELANDSNPRMLDVVVGIFQQAMADEIDRCIAYGDGSGKMTGIYQASTIADVSGATAVSYANMLKIKHKVDMRWHTDSSCRWLFNQNVLNDIEGLLDANEQPLFRQNTNLGMPPTLLGHPFIVHNGLPNTFMGFGALRNYYIFDIGDMGMESTTTGGDSFKKHQILTKLWRRLDGKYINPPHKSFARTKVLSGVTAAHQNSLPEASGA